MWYGGAVLIRFHRKELQESIKCWGSKLSKYVDSGSQARAKGCDRRGC